MIKFRNLGPRISLESIEIISSTPWPKTPKADLPDSQSSAVSLNSPVTLVASSSTPVTESMDHGTAIYEKTMELSGVCKNFMK